MNKPQTKPLPKPQPKPSEAKPKEDFKKIFEAELKKRYGSKMASKIEIIF